MPDKGLGPMSKMSIVASMNLLGILMMRLRRVPLLSLLVLLLASTSSFAQSSRVPTPDQALAAFDAGRLDEAAELWRERADALSDPEAFYRLGLLAKSGHLPSGGIDQAAVWFRRGANLGHAGSAYELGRLYWEGLGVVEGKSLAKSYWRDAAELDLPEAQYALAHAYRETDRTRTAEIKAQFWLRRAADNGYSEAVAELGGGVTPAVVEAPLTDAAMPADEPVQEEVKADEAVSSAAPLSGESHAEISVSQVVPGAGVDAVAESPVAVIAPEPEPEPAAPVASSRGLTLYAYRSEDGPPIMTLSSADSLERLDTDGEWVRVRVSEGLLGWVSAEYLNISGSEARATTNVRVRVRPGLTDDAVPMDSGLKAGDRVQVLQVEDGWARVRLPERFSAWVKAAALSGP